jgi:HSP20 family molecular chaperone IbpA
MRGGTDAVAGLVGKHGEERRCAMLALRTDELCGEYVVCLHVMGIPDSELDVGVDGRVVSVSFELPADVDAGHVTTSCSHGVVELHAPLLRHHFAVNADASGV